ncbi:hypothetical protein CANARDRAFT_175586 [[Candida] arabinofermentans NRRL YB-2248]|uniref:Endoplasmic reticulum lectin n=1 Tax=[Candida] arabinofermentans NRRL YB-2248 TaxID=983967 RepID=A0A1E4T240_9ASCO|nr:hypothetical protein CANARDRAFT_175586 [[Candida] arabinofermentans NRRL YB-2248]
MIWGLSLLFFLKLIDASKVMLDESLPEYQVRYTNDWVTEDDLLQMDISPSSNFTRIQKDGVSYVCEITDPGIIINHIAKSKDSHVGSEQEKLEAIQVVKSFIEGYFDELKKQDSIVTIESEASGYWKYGVSDVDISQKHVEFRYDMLDITIITLGKISENCFDKVSDFELLTTSDGSNYLTQATYHGEVCDLTGKERTTLLKYVCDKNYAIPALTNVIETQTCQYEITVSSAKLCESSLFNTMKDTVVGNVTCNPIKPSSSYDFELTHEKLSLMSLNLKPIGYNIFIGEYKSNLNPDGSVKPKILVTNRDFPFIRIGNDNAGPIADDLKSEQGVGTSYYENNQLQKVYFALDPKDSILENIRNAFINVGRYGHNIYQPIPAAHDPTKVVFVTDDDNYVFRAELYGKDGLFIGNVRVDQMNGEVIADFESLDNQRPILQNFEYFNDHVLI